VSGSPGRRLTMSNLITNLRYLYGRWAFPLNMRKEARERASEMTRRCAGYAAHARLLKIWEERVQRMHDYSCKLEATK
jgi:hypothetical protein